jgi:hypothetical protein
MRSALVLLVALAALCGTATASAPVRGGAFCWDFDLVGTDAADRLQGTAAPDHAAGYDGDDTLLLFGGDDCAATGFGNDVVHLGPGDDEADGGTAADHLYGGPGDDTLMAGLGPDHLEGGDGDDLLRDERGDAASDVLAGGPGHDVIRSVDFGADAVDCGPGYDVAVVDARDTAADCERVAVARHRWLTSRSLRTGVRPAFAVAWAASDVALPARIGVRLVAHPAPRAGCAVRAWRASGGRPLRLAWRGATAACPGEYAFALTAFSARPGGERVACQRLAGSPRTGCAPGERLGVVAVAVR